MQRSHPSVVRIAGIARALREVSGDVVFIGGAIAPLLQTNLAIPTARPTVDVDAVLASTSYANHAALSARLRTLGFSPDLLSVAHVHRWRAPDGTPFDLVPAGGHLGATGGRWDFFAIQNSVETEIEPGLRIRHASSIGFLALKWAAFWDRGIQDPFGSADLEDIIALLVSRDEIVTEFQNSPGDLQDYLRKGFGWLSSNANYADLVAACLGNAISSGFVAVLCQHRIIEIVEA